MEITALFATSFLVALSGAMVPGPLLTAVITESARRGFWAGPAIVLGHAILELILLLALVAGLANYFSKDAFTSVIGLLGGAFLLYMGFTMIKEVKKGEVSVNDLNKVEEQTGHFHPVITGILLSLANPYWTIWWITIGFTYISLSLKSGIAGLASFYSGHILADLSWFSLIAAAVAGGRRFLNQRLYDAVFVFCGIFLLGLGAYFIYSGIFIQN